MRKPNLHATVFCPMCEEKVKRRSSVRGRLVYSFFLLIAVQAGSASSIQLASASVVNQSERANKSGAASVTTNTLAVAACDEASTQSGVLKRVTGDENVLRNSPTPNGSKLINKKATAAFKETHYLTIDPSVTVREECSKSGWSRVQVVEPRHLTDTHIGWVKSDVLRGQQKNANGTLTFSEDDIVWDKGTTPYKKLVVAGVNKVHQENPRCRDIDVATVTKSPSKGTKTDPVFFVSCGRGTDSFNAFFSKSDIEKGVSLSGANLDRSQAVDLCRAHIKNKANHPSSVDFSVLQVIEHANGRTTVDASFTAKNSFNLEAKYKVHCLLNQNGIMEAQIAEAR